MDAVAELLGIDIDAQPRTVLYWYNENAAGPEGENSDICLYCSSCGGCYTRNTIISTSKNLLHELVHAVVVPAWGRSDSLFEEGIAGGLDRRLGGVADVTTIFSVLSNDSPTEMAGTGFHSDGHFSRWLVDRFGPERFSELFEQLTNSDSKDAVISVVESIYGMPFDELEAEYFETAPTVYPIPGFCDGLLHVPWTADRWELSVGAQCDAPHVYGPRDDASTRPSSSSLATIASAPGSRRHAVATRRPASSGQSATYAAASTRAGNSRPSMPSTRRRGSGVRR